MSKVELFENERALGYDQFVETWIPNYHIFLDQLPKLLRTAVSQQLLIVGCGTGNEIRRFVGVEPSWKITGVDPSPDMIRQATQKFHTYHHVTFFEGLVSDLESSNRYGAATLLLVLHFLEDNGDKLTLLRDIAARLLPQAPLVLLDITGDGDQIDANLKILRLLLPDGLEEAQIQHRMHRITHELKYVSEGRLSELCEEAGLEQPVRFFQSSIYVGWMTRKK
ncbi:class I SAM-dependent methyltransferase [Sphingobacterium thalpophilum]|uniref:Class I SAM-dependent methyltransferase n=1 Tax=Sphingobacterium thalpophilum TaxID=259 RepID=A0ABV4HEE9_9SPHI|nr:class I SAM-dependent methyltransferase [Sphingobacterium thalpophilum]